MKTSWTVLSLDGVSDNLPGWRERRTNLSSLKSCSSSRLSALKSYIPLDSKKYRPHEHQVKKEERRTIHVLAVRRLMNHWKTNHLLCHVRDDQKSKMAAQLRRWRIGREIERITSVHGCKMLLYSARWWTKNWFSLFDWARDSNLKQKVCLQRSLPVVIYLFCFLFGSVCPCMELYWARVYFLLFCLWPYTYIYYNISISLHYVVI